MHVIKHGVSTIDLINIVFVWRANWWIWNVDIQILITNFCMLLRFAEKHPQLWRTKVEEKYFDYSTIFISALCSATLVSDNDGGMLFILCLTAEVALFIITVEIGHCISPFGFYAIMKWKHCTTTIHQPPHQLYRMLWFCVATTFATRWLYLRGLMSKIKKNIRVRPLFKFSRFYAASIDIIFKYQGYVTEKKTVKQPSILIVFSCL